MLTECHAGMAVSRYPDDASDFSPHLSAHLPSVTGSSAGKFLM